MASPKRFTVLHARKVLAVVDQGLVCGIGVPEPGKLCVEAAVCLALGLPHGDEPDCVAAPDRAFKIGLNDADWSSPTVRAAGLRRLAVLQLGTRDRSRVEWAQRLTELTIRRVLPVALRAARLEEAAARCERDGDEAAAWAAARAAAEAAWAAEAAEAARADAVLRLAADCAEQAYRDTGAPGVALLDRVLKEEASRG